MRPSGIFNTSYNQDLAIVRTRLQWVMFIALIVALFALPVVVQGYIIGFLVLIGISAIAALGLMLLMGYCGQISLGHSAFMGVGGFTAALLVLKLGISFWLALPAAGIMAGLTGLVFGAPSLRLKGFYLALATLAAQFILMFLLYRFFGGASGVRVAPPSIGGLALDSDHRFYYLVMALLVLLTFFAKSLARGRTGRAFVAIRDNDIAAETMGINVFGYKLLAFFIGCFYAGIAGALWVFWLGVAQAAHYTLMESIWYLSMMVVGGIGSISGALFGTVFIRVVAEVGRRLAPMIGGLVPALALTVGAALPDIFIGLAIVIFLILEPRGLSHRWEMFKASYRLHPFSY
jgi:branched-chain amino acid transport system permease protein